MAFLENYRNNADISEKGGNQLEHQTFTLGAHKR
jgi:hypothetical protein